MSKDLKGSASFKEIADYYKVSTVTLRLRLKPYRKFFAVNKLKRVYYEKELQFIKRILGDVERKEGQSINHNVE